MNPHCKIAIYRAQVAITQVAAMANWEVSVSNKVSLFDGVRELEEQQIVLKRYAKRHDHNVTNNQTLNTLPD